jgi:uncharacterized membrane protein
VYAIGSLLVVVAVGLLITRVATVMLIATGLSRESARFQARSAFTGAGFTTSEAEAIVNHPFRRRIVSVLMLLGNAGIVTVLGSLVLGFAADSSGRTWNRVVLLAGGLLLLVALARSSFVDRRLTRLIRAALARWTDVDTRDYAGLLDLAGGYSIVELMVREGDWVANRRLAELSLRDEGIAVLGIDRGDGSYRGSATGAAVVRPGDTLVVYGRLDQLRVLDSRTAGAEGDRQHALAVAEQERRLALDELGSGTPQPG